MARSATAEVEGQVSEDSADEKQTRKRVDPSTLDPNEKVVLSFHIPAGMRVQLRTEAESAGKSEAQYVRDMVAGQIGYTIPESFNERRGRVGQYSGLSEEEKKAAIKAENDKKRDNVAKLLAAVNAGQIGDDVLAALGIDKASLPKPRTAKDDAEDAA